MGGGHAVFLELGESAARADSLVLTNVSDEDEAVFLVEAPNEPIDLPRVGQRGLIEGVDSALGLVPRGPGLHEEALEGGNLHAGVGEFPGGPAVGAKPRTCQPSASSSSRMTRRVNVFPVPAAP